MDGESEPEPKPESDPESEPERGGEADAGSDGDGPIEFVVLGGPDDGPTLDLDHEQFAYAGKFVMSGTGKAVARESGPNDGSADARGDVLAAVAFDRDRTDGAVVRLRYVTVRRDRRGEGLGARLLASVADWLLGGARRPSGQDGGGASAETGSTLEDVREVRIAVNNPFAYEAAFKAGFGYTGERTGLAELVCARPGDRSAAAYRRGLSAFSEREDAAESERTFVGDRRDAAPPETASPLPRR